MSKQPRQLWRNMAIVGFMFSLAVVNSFLGSAVLFGFTAETLTGALEGQDTRIFPDATSGQQPFILALMMVLGLPFILSSFFHLMRCKAFISSQAIVLYQAIYGLAMAALGLAVLINACFAVTELYSHTPSERHLTAALNVLALYSFVLMLGLAGMLFGIEMLRQKLVPTWLSWVSIMSNLMAILLQIMAQNPEYPAFRFMIGLPFASLDIIVWAFFLWLLSMGDSEKTTLIKTR